MFVLQPNQSVLKAALPSHYADLPYHDDRRYGGEEDIGKNTYPLGAMLDGLPKGHLLGGGIHGGLWYQPWRQNATQCANAIALSVAAA